MVFLLLKIIFLFLITKNFLKKYLVNSKAYLVKDLKCVLKL